MENIAQNLRDSGKQYGFTSQDLNSRVRLQWGDGRFYNYTIEGLQLTPIVVARSVDDGESYRFPIDEVLTSLGREMPKTPTPPAPTPPAPEKGNGKSGKPIPPVVDKNGKIIPSKAVEKAVEASKPVSTKHMQFDTLLAICKAALAKPQSRINILLKGGAGGGKSTAAENVAKELGLKYYGKSMGPQTSESTLLGYMDMKGTYVPGICYEPFVKGGLLNLDEIDASNPGVLTTLNSLLSNNQVAFPNGMQTRHPKFVCVASANTWGKGADSSYVGRQQLDAATLDRFVACEWDYDESFERHLVLGIAGKEKKDQAIAMDWCAYVQTLRAAAFKTGVKVMFSPRKSLHGSTLLLAGQTREAVERIVLWAPVSADDKQKVLANLSL